MDDSGLTKGRKPVVAAHDQTKKFTTDSNINLATRQTSILDKGTPRPWRIGITILSMGIQIILDLTENVAIGRSYPETELFQGVDLSPFNAYDLGISRRHALLALDGDRVVIVDNDSAATLTLRSTMLLGAIEKQSCSIAKSLAAITAQLNSCINFFIYALRHNKFRQHLRLMCGGDKNSLQTAIAVPSVKASTLPSAPEGMRVIRY